MSWCMEQKHDLAADVNILETFYMQYQRQALDIRWWAHMSNAEVRQRSTIYQPLTASCVIVAYLCLTTLHV